MAKYDPLYDYLRNQPDHNVEITLTFEGIESILGARLPPSARHHRAWWANPTDPTQHPYAQAWLAAGWRVAEVDQTHAWVHFSRT